MLPRRNPWTLGLGAIGAILLWAVITLFVALFGLGQIGPNIDLDTLPAWLWYYRGDPLLADWIRLGAMAGAAVVALLVLTILRRGPALHGRARFAREGEIRNVPRPPGVQRATHPWVFELQIGVPSGV